MPPTNPFDTLIKQVMTGLGLNTGAAGGGGEKPDAKCRPPLTPALILVIAGILGGVLKVDSIQVDKDQIVYLVLAGDLKQKTQMDYIMDQVGEMPFGDVLGKILEHFG